MSYTIRKRMALVFLVVLSTWPLAHHAWVRTSGANPWKWFGWSMYTTTQPTLKVYTLSGVSGQRLPRLQSLPRETQGQLQRAYKAFGDRAQHFGYAVEPLGFARSLFQAYPREDHIVIVVHRVGLNRVTAKFEMIHEQRFDYHRADPGPDTR